MYPKILIWPIKIDTWHTAIQYNTILHTTRWWQRQNIGQGRMSDFSIVIQIRWKIHSALIQVVVKRSQWNFKHSTTAIRLDHMRFRTTANMSQLITHYSACFVLLNKRDVVFNIKSLPILGTPKEWPKSNWFLISTRLRIVGELWNSPCIDLDGYIVLELKRIAWSAQYSAFNIDPNGGYMIYVENTQCLCCASLCSTQVSILTKRSHKKTGLSF